MKTRCALIFVVTKTRVASGFFRFFLSFFVTRSYKGDSGGDLREHVDFQGGKHFGGRSSRTCRFSRGKTRLHYNFFVYMIILKFRISKFSTLARLIITYLYFYNMSTYLCYEIFPVNLFSHISFWDRRIK